MINFQYEINNNIKLVVPHESVIYHWIYLLVKQHYKSFMPTINKDTNLTIRFVEYKDIYKLNNYYRGITYITNILSFSYENNSIKKPQFLGELVISPNFIFYEALKNNITFINHFAHIIIHGCLHLFGYNHTNVSDAYLMENIEYSILNQINLLL